MIVSPSASSNSCRLNRSRNRAGAACCATLIPSLLGTIARLVGLVLAQTVLPEEPVEVDAINFRGARGGGDVVVVLDQERLEVALFEITDAIVSRDLERLGDVDPVGANHRFRGLGVGVGRQVRVV